jgi:hypothetical protein
VADEMMGNDHTRCDDAQQVDADISPGFLTGELHG